MTEEIHPDEATMEIAQKAMDVAMKKLIKDITKKIVQEIRPDVEDKLHPDNQLAPYFEEAFLEVHAKARQLVARVKATIHGTDPAASFAPSCGGGAVAARPVSLGSSVPTDSAPFRATVGGQPVDVAAGRIPYVVDQVEDDGEDPERDVAAEKVMAAIVRLLPATKGEALSYASIKDATGFPDSELEAAFMELCGEDLVRKRKPLLRYVENAFWLPQLDPRKITYAAGKLFERITRRAAAGSDPQAAASTEAATNTTVPVAPAPAPCPPGTTRYLATVAFVDKVGEQPWTASRIIVAASHDEARHVAQEFALDIAFEASAWVNEADGLPFDQAQEVLKRNGFLVGEPDVTPLDSVEVSASNPHGASAPQPSACALPAAVAAGSDLPTPSPTSASARGAGAEGAAHRLPHAALPMQVTGMPSESPGVLATAQSMVASPEVVSGGVVALAVASSASPSVSGGVIAGRALLASERLAQLDAMTSSNLRLLVSAILLGRKPLMSFQDALIAGKKAVKARLLQHEIETGVVVDDIGFAGHRDEGPVDDGRAFGPAVDADGNDHRDLVVRS